MHKIISAIMFGMIMRPLKMSDIVHTVLSSRTAPTAAAMQYKNLYTY